MAVISLLLYCIILLFCVRLDTASSFSSPRGTEFVKSSIRGKGLFVYHFGAVTDNSRKKTPDNFPYQNNRSSSYVPDGLTEEQYAQIKKDDLEKLRGKNFGAWGPRFNRIDVPEGNWFSISSLWTSGFDSNAGDRVSVESNLNDNVIVQLENGVTKNTSPLLMRLRKYGFAYLTLFLSMKFVSNTLVPRKALSLNVIPMAVRNFLLSRKLILECLLPLVALKPLAMLSRVANEKEIGLLKQNGIAKISAIVSVLLITSTALLR